MRSHPKLALARSFVRALRDSDKSRFVLSHAAGFASKTQLSTFLNSPRVRATPLVRERLTRLAGVLDYDGPVLTRCAVANLTAWMPPEAAAACCHVDAMTLCRAVKRGALQGFRVNGGRSVRYSRGQGRARGFVHDDDQSLPAHTNRQPDERLRTSRRPPGASGVEGRQVRRLFRKATLQAAIHPG